MSRSTYLQPLPQDRFHEIALGYNQYNLQIQGGYNINPQLSAAGLWSTPSDLARFGIEIMMALQGKSAFLEKKSAELMSARAYENHPLGVGFAVNECRRGATFGHSGANIGYRSNMVFCPADGSGIVVMQNADIGAGIPGEVTNAFKDIYGW